MLYLIPIKFRLDIFTSIRLMLYLEKTGNYGVNKALFYNITKNLIFKSRSEFIHCNNMRTAQIWLDQFFPIFNSTLSSRFKDKVGLISSTLSLLQGQG